jgi:Bardet-Biedl syndrome 2 protein
MTSSPSSPPLSPLLSGQIYQDKMRAHFAGVKPHPDHLANKKGYQGSPLFIFASREEGGTAVQVRCDDMELTAEVVQDLAAFFKLRELQSTVNFPQEMSKFERVLQEVAEFNALRVKMSADMADDSQRVKALVVRAEDARIMTDMETMGRAYTDLYSLNNQLIAGYNNRMQSHSGLLGALKEVNQMIQKAANLRMGAAKTRVVTDCRVAVKANNMQSLFRIIKQGFDNAGKK